MTDSVTTEAVAQTNAKINMLTEQPETHGWILWVGLPFLFHSLGILFYLKRIPKV